VGRQGCAAGAAVAEGGAMTTRGLVGAVVAAAGLLTIILTPMLIGTIPALIIGVVLLLVGGFVLASAGFTDDL
jgi:hypothetical protein